LWPAAALHQELLPKSASLCQQGSATAGEQVTGPSGRLAQSPLVRLPDRWSQSYDEAESAGRSSGAASRLQIQLERPRVPELSQWQYLLVAQAAPLAAAEPLAGAAGVQPWHWITFAVVVVVLLALDLVVFHRESREPTLRESAIWTVIWCLIALAFNGLVWWWFDANRAVLFLTGYLVEWSLSMDNVFVFAVIFTYYRVPLMYQYRVLFWGILGAILMRLTFVLAGTALIQRFDWVMPLFGLFLVYTAVKLVWQEDAEVDPERNLLRRLASRVFYVADEGHGQRFFVKQAGHWAVTPLFLVLLVIESTDVAFAVDSVPAILSVTDDKFIVFTSNIFAILGLRALYFLLAGVMDMFRYLKYGLAGVLGFLGLKMIAEFCDKRFRGGAGHLIPPLVSLAIILGMLAIAIIASIVANHRQSAEVDPPSAA
jgi:tellurite resistance protein TerC